MVGQVAANLRALRPPDPYKQKGIRITGERLKKKAGKAGAQDRGVRAPGLRTRRSERGNVPVRKFSRKAHRQRIHVRIRKTIAGTTERPRLCVYRSSSHIHAQVINDAEGRTLVSASSLDEEVRKQIKGGGNVAAAKVVGKVLAERAKAQGVEKVVFDRGGYQYHGRVQALAEAAREAGLKF